MRHGLPAEIRVGGRSNGRVLPIKIGARGVNRGYQDDGDGGECPGDRVHDREVDVDTPATGEGLRIC